MKPLRSLYLRDLAFASIWFVLDLVGLMLLTHSGLDPYSARVTSCLLAYCATLLLAFRIPILGTETWFPQWEFGQSQFPGLVTNLVAYSIIVLTFPGTTAALLLAITVGAVAGVFVTSFLRSLDTKPLINLSGLSIKQKRAVAVVPALFGVYSVILGADANWDLYNYHLYGPFSLIHDKIGTDLAVGGFQGYFNPSLDVTPYILNTSLFPPLAGFLHGAFHGLVFVIIFLIARNVLPQSFATSRFRLPFLLALLGSLTANFMSELGTTMGDNTTAVFALFGLLLLTTYWDAIGAFDRRSIAILGLSGLAMGFATGLKIISGVSAISTCLALLFCYPKPWRGTFQIAFLFGVAVLFGFGLSGAPWMVRMWMEFGNPLFPQFGTIFPNPLAAPMAVADTRWLPKNVVEYILWPFLLSFDTTRGGEIHARQIIWPLLFVAVTVFIIRRTAVGRRFNASMPVSSKEAFLITYVILSFWIWTFLFSISRYTVAFEVLGPLCIFILISKAFPSPASHKPAVWLLLGAALVSATNFHRNWGHQSWSTPVYHVDLPHFERPERTTVLLASRTEPLGWLAAMFSPDVVFMNLASSFPSGPNFADEVRQRLKSRDGDIVVFTEGEPYHRANKVAFYQRTAAAFGLTRSEWGCNFLKSVVGPFQMKADVVHTTSGLVSCRLAVRAEDQIDVTQSNRDRIASAEEVLTTFGLSLKTSSCRIFHAGVGGERRPYQVCFVDWIQSP